MVVVPVPVVEAPGSRPDLYRWQFDALVDWVRCGRRGVIEAVTGSGKTDVALAAIGDALRRDRFVLVVVPTRVLLEQWCGRLATAFPDVRIGRLGDTGRDQPETCDVLVATRHSAATHRPGPPEGRGGLLVADECHGLGGGILRRALLPDYDERLGLTATLERSDDAVTDLLVPYFGGVCFRYGFEAAIADGVCARPRVAFVGVPLSVEERQEYVATEQQLISARAHLRRVRGMPLGSFGEFLAAVAHLAERDVGADGRAAREYLDAFARRRQIVAQSSGKAELLGRFAGLIRRADGALVFTETVRAANQVVMRLDPVVSVDVITGTTARRHRRVILDDLRGRRLDAVVAPRVLDEGIDVPDADLGIVVNASRTRRQMIQRMGRILRRKRPGVGARFVILYATDTIEDPSMRFERDGFLDEIERIALESANFDAADFERIEAFLDQPGPQTVVEPHRVGPLAAVPGPGGPGGTATDPHAPIAPMPAPGPVALARGDAAAWATLDDEARRLAAGGAGTLGALDALVDDVAARIGDANVYAAVSFLRWPGTGPLQHAVWDRVGPRLPEPERLELPYLELELADLPDIGTPRVPPRRLSTGVSPLEIAELDGGWRMRCTGCGQQSEPVRFRWQVLEGTVECRCT